MSPAVYAVLLVPAKGDPHNLLGDPSSTAWKCGARPPVARQCFICRNWYLTPTPCHPAGSEYEADRRRKAEPQALVLAWGEQPVLEGMDRLSRVPIVSTAGRVGPPRWGYDMRSAKRWAESAAKNDRGTAVILHTAPLFDAKGMEMPTNG